VVRVRYGGQWQPPTSPAEESNPQGCSTVAIGDVDGDHVPDVAVGGWNDEHVYVFHGNADGTLAGPKVYQMPFWYSWNVHIADLDGVGDVTADQPNDLTVIYSSGKVVSYTPGVIGSHTVGDVNGDGRPDVIVGRPFSYSYTVGVMFNQGDGSLGPPVSVPMARGPFVPVVADFNRDRKPDIAASTGDHVTVALGNGDGTFRPPSSYYAASNPFAQTVGDLNHDGYPDLVLVNYNARTIQVLLNDANWSPPVPPPGPGRSADPPATVRADAGRSVNPSREQVKAGAESAASPLGKAASASVASRPRWRHGAPHTPATFDVLPEPFARAAGVD
jgi:hypothetical protein